MSGARISNEARRAASQQAVLAAAGHLFVAQGYEHTSMTQIAKAAGLTKGAIYFYYKDKADLLRMALENANAQTFLPVAQQIRQSDRTPTTRLVQFSNAVARLGVDRREELLLPVLMGAEFAGSGAAAGRLIRN